MQNVNLQINLKELLGDNTILVNKQELYEMFEKIKAPKEIYTRKEMCEVLGVKTDTLHKYMTNKKMPYHEISDRVIVFKMSEILVWLDGLKKEKLV